MEKKKELFFECPLHGRKYYDADLVWNKLKIGEEVLLKRDLDNRHDPNAIAVQFCEGTTFDNLKVYTIGYIPRECNEDLAKFMDMGWEEIFSCRITRIDEDAHYEQQIKLTVWIDKKEDRDN